MSCMLTYAHYCRLRNGDGWRLGRPTAAAAIMVVVVQMKVLNGQLPPRRKSKAAQQEKDGILEADQQLRTIPLQIP